MSVYYDVLPVRLRYYHFVNEMVVGPFSLLANAVLSFLLLTEQNRMLRTYSRVLLINSAVDIIYAVIILLTQYQIEFIDGEMVVIITGVLRHLPMPWHHCICLVMVAFCTLSIFNLPTTFFFRYMLVVKGRELSIRQLIATLCLPASASVFHAYLIMMSTKDDDETRHESMCTALLKHPIWNHPDDVNVDKCMYPAMDSQFMIVSMISASILNISAYTTMIYCTITLLGWIQQRESAKQVSSKSVGLQRQFNRMLFVQMLVSLCVSNIPVLVMCISSLLHINIPGLGLLVSTAYSWVPLICPLTTILLVENFYRRLFAALVRPFCSHSKFNAASNITAVKISSCTEDLK